MEKITVLIFVFSMIRIAAGEVSMRICEADGVTPFERGEIMVGTKLTIIVSSDSGGFWNGGLFITDQKRAYGVLSARGFDPNTGDWADSHYEAAGETAMVSSYRDSWMWGFDLCTDSDAEAGDWFIIDYTAIDIGDPNVGFYEYHISWDDPNFLVDISHVATRDFNNDDIVNLLDYNMLASNWIEVDCSEPNWCDLTDISRDGEVDILDLALFSEFWLWESLQPNQRGGEKDGGSGKSGGDPGEGEDPNASAYAYVVTVGQSISNEEKYDFNTINAAIVAMSLHTLNADHRGGIQVYPGTYIEQLNDFYSNCRNLPAHCDLIGMGAEPQDVIIQHQRRGSTDPDFAGIGPEIYAYGVKAQGDNLISHLSIRNVGLEQNSLLFYQGGTLDNCLITSLHDAVTAHGHLTLSGGTIKGKYRPCVHAYGSFEISDCTIIPDTNRGGGEHPAGIKVTKSGTIDNVTIRADVASSDYEPHYDTPWLAGVITQLLNPDDTVTITNSSIDLTLTTLYHNDRPKETATWELFGVVSGGRNPTPTTKYPGKTIIEDCQINLTGIEDSSNPNGDGRGIMVAGVCLQGGGEIEVLGNTTILTSRTTAGFAKDGYEYSLNNQNGEMVIERDTVKYDSVKTNGIIKEK